MTQKRLSFKRSVLGLLTCLMVLPISSGPLLADEYPTRPIQLVIPFSPGGITDTVGRLLADQSKSMLNQATVILNKPGAGSTLGMNFVSKADPGGYTIGIGANSALAVRKVIDPNLPYDPLKDFSFICKLVEGPNVILVREDSPHKTLQDLIDFAKKNPGKLTYGSSGAGTTLHLTGELLKQGAGIDMIHVPHKGASPALMALLGGHIDLICSNYVGAAAQIKAGKVIPLAVTSKGRFKKLPDVPSVAELGYPSVVIGFFLGAVGPPNLDRSKVEKLAEFFKGAMAAPPVQEKMEALGILEAYAGPDDFKQYVDDLIKKMADLVQKANIKLQ